VDDPYIIAGLRGQPLRPYHHRYLGSEATLGHRQGVAQVYRLRLHGFIAWLIARGYHLAWVPTLNHKTRIMADWAISMIFHADAIPFSDLEHPGQEFTRALDMRQFTPDHEDASGRNRQAGRTVMATTSA